MKLKPFKHQTKTTEFILNNTKCLITSDPGTGKTRSVLDAFSTFSSKERLLVLAPLSILQASWGDDIQKFTPELTYSVAYARNRETAFKDNSNIVLTNHDAVKWIAKNPELLEQFSMLCIDEFTAFKNSNSQRSKAALAISDKFDRVVAMSGTPNSNSITDIWHPALLVDGGERLGRRFYTFRQHVCTPIHNGFGIEWKDKADAEETVAVAIGDISIRFELEQCIDMPEQSTHCMYTTLPKKIQQQYNQLAEDSVLYTGKRTINAIHAGAKVKKLLQLCTGAVYDQNGEYAGIHEERYDMIIDLIKNRKHSLVAFNWKHEREALVAKCQKEKINYGVIDGETPAVKRTEVVNRLQAGQLQVVFAHPQSAGHGLTMTKATTVIWASPTYNAEHYQQFNRRIYRAGQTQKTQIIQIAARNTWEPDVYEKLESKLGRMENLLSVLNQLHEVKKAS